MIRCGLENFYYWVNFAPITRGTSATGYAALYSTVLAVDEELVGRIPYMRQLDWEVRWAAVAVCVAVAVGSLRIYECLVSVLLLRCSLHSRH